MPRKFRLTWQPGTSGRAGRWRKKYKGKAYYFDGGRGKFDREAYNAALDAWDAQKARLDAAAPRPHQVDYEHAISEWEQVFAWSNRHSDQNMAAIAFDRLDDLRRRFEAPVLKPLIRSDRFESQFELQTISLPDDIIEKAAADLANGRVQFRYPPQLPPDEAAEIAAMLDGSPARISREIWNDRLKMQQRRAAIQEDSLSAYVDKYIRVKEQQQECGELSVGSVYAIRCHLACFRDWLGRDSAITDIDGSTLMDYRGHLLDNLKSKEWTRTTAWHYLKTVKAFVRWLWQIEAIPSLPRVLDGKMGPLKISTTTSQVVVFTDEEVCKLLKAASDRTKLYILLMLNCGMTQKDVSDLKSEEIDWEEGRIIRKRSKTSGHKNVPTVSYLLWPETLRLLRQEQSIESNNRVLQNANGSALCTQTLGADGKFKKTDNVKNAFDRLCKKTGIKKPLKSLKKTSATLLRGDERFQGLEGLFLGHAPQSMSDKHYTLVPGKLLDQAVLWLESQYGFGLEEANDSDTASNDG